MNNSDLDYRIKKITIKNMMDCKSHLKNAALKNNIQKLCTIVYNDETQ